MRSSYTATRTVLERSRTALLTVPLCHGPEWNGTVYTTQPKVYRSENGSIAQNARIMSVKWSVSEFFRNIFDTDLI